MRPIILMATVVALASGLLGAFAYGELFGSASAAPPATAVREQNLDTNGLIRVHEQGTANVNVTNASLPVSGTVDVGNLPTVQDVNVVAMPSQQGRHIALGTQTAGTSPYLSPFANVSDCERATIMATSSNSGAAGASFVVLLDASPDGSQAIGLAPDGNRSDVVISGVRGVSISAMTVVAPFVRVEASLNTGETTNITAWIWCEP